MEGNCNVPLRRTLAKAGLSLLLCYFPQFRIHILFSDEPTRLYIRGRSLNLYPPSDYVEDKNVGLPPDQKLELEWVYP